MDKKIETIAADKLRTVSGGFLGFGGAGHRFPVVRNLWQRFAGGGASGGCAGGGCPQQG